MLAAQRQGRLVVGFDLEDTNPLGGEIGMIQAYYDLGVRSMLMTYNGQNLAGFGCHAPDDTGLDDQARACAATGGVIGINDLTAIG
jgi:microsomal dipeptidase-like Zn-dependent dipeptidase